LGCRSTFFGVGNERGKTGIAVKGIKARLFFDVQINSRL
jgi:hypothetical protein